MARTSVKLADLPELVIETDYANRIEVIVRRVVDNAPIVQTREITKLLWESMGIDAAALATKAERRLLIGRARWPGERTLFDVTMEAPWRNTEP